MWCGRCFRCSWSGAVGAVGVVGVVSVVDVVSLLSFLCGKCSWCKRFLLVVVVKRVVWLNRFFIVFYTTVAFASSEISIKVL